MDCCEACVKKVRKAVKGMEGVNSVEIEREANKLTVTGYVEPSDVVSRIAHRTGNKAEILSYVSYENAVPDVVPSITGSKAQIWSCVPYDDVVSNIYLFICFIVLLSLVVSSTCMV